MLDIAVMPTGNAELPDYSPSHAGFFVDALER